MQQHDLLLERTRTLTLPLPLTQVLSNTVFYSMVLAIGYSWFSIAQGKTPDQVPVVSEANPSSTPNPNPSPDPSPSPTPNPTPHQVPVVSEAANQAIGPF